MLDKLKKMTDGDPDRMNMLIRTYKEGIGEYIELLSAAIESNNIAEIRKAAHTSKPLFTIMGFTELWNLANEIEESIDNQKEEHLLQERSLSLLSEMQHSLDSLHKFQ